MAMYLKTDKTKKSPSKLGKASVLEQLSRRFGNPEYPMKWMMKTILIIGFPRLQSIIAYKCMIKGVKALLYWS